MTEIEEFTKELNSLVEKYDARLYIEAVNIDSADLCVDFPESHSHLVFDGVSDSIDYLSDKEQCTECGKILNSEIELENELCDICINEAVMNETSFREGLTELE